MNKKLSYLRIVVIVAVIALVIIGVTTNKLRQKRAQLNNAVVMAGLTEGQRQSFQKDLSAAFEQVRLLDKGEKLVKEVKFDEGIKQLTFALEKEGGDKRIALIALANAYEKNVIIKTH